MRRLFATLGLIFAAGPLFASDGAAIYHQNYNPLGNVALSTLVAAIPILALLYFIALHPHRDKRGARHLGISAPYAAFFGVIAAFLVSCLVFRMPFASAFSAFAFGSLSGFLGIIWIVLGAMFLYTMTVVTGKFEIVKESIIHISFDRRLQVLLIAFSFGAIIEGTSGFGTPVAIAGAVMVGLGFSPFDAAVLNLIANTAPVAFGAIGTPIVVLSQVSGLDQLTLSSMAGRQLPFVSVLIPFWLVTTFVLMQGGKLKEAWEVWPATLCSGVSFALMQFVASQTAAFHLMTDVVAGVFSVVCTALFLRFVWHPKTRFLLRSERQGARLDRGCGDRRSRKWCAGRCGHTATARRVDVQVHLRRDRIRLDSVGDSDRLLCYLGNAELEELSQRPLCIDQDQYDLPRFNLRRHALPALLGHARLASTWCSACLPWRR